jgi:hypothetical protein
LRRQLRGAHRLKGAQRFGRDQPLDAQRCGDDIGGNAACAVFVQELQNHLIAFQPLIIHLDAVLGAERGGERTYDLIDDQRRV